MLNLRTWGTVRAACRQSGPYTGSRGRIQAVASGLTRVMVSLLSGGPLDALGLLL